MECYYDCQRDYIRNCDSSTYGQCVSDCSNSTTTETVTPAVSEDCANAQISCYDDYVYGNTDWNGYSDCLNAAYNQYGYQNCLCGYSATELKKLDEVSGSVGAKDMECYYDCQRDYIRDCDSSAYGQCVSNCGSASFTVEQFSTSVKDESAFLTYWVVGGTFLACILTLAGILIYKRRTSQKLDYDYEQMHA